jgi:hypothetical protein
VAYFKLIFLNSPGGYDKSTKNLINDCQCPGQDSNQVPPKCVRSITAWAKFSHLKTGVEATPKGPERNSVFVQWVSHYQKHLEKLTEVEEQLDTEFYKLFGLQMCTLKKSALRLSQTRLTSTPLLWKRNRLLHGRLLLTVWATCMRCFNSFCLVILIAPVGPQLWAIPNKCHKNYLLTPFARKVIFRVSTPSARTSTSWRRSLCICT